jgi:hypothetical protein
MLISSHISISKSVKTMKLEYFDNYIFLRIMWIYTDNVE